jgi:hypothetical protein
MTALPSDPADLSYAYRPSVLGATWSFRLTPAAIVWDAGRKSGRVSYGDVTQVRLSFRPATLQTYRFVTEVWATDGTKLQIVSSSWKSMVEQTRLDGDYRAFVGELHRRLAASGAPIAFIKGVNPPLYWAGIVVFVATALVTAALITRSIQAGASGAAILIGGFLAVFLWRLGTYFRRNRPGLYAPDTLPAEPMPDG